MSSGKINVYHLVLFLKVGICFAMETKVMMLIKNGDGSDFKTLWDTVGGVNDVVGKSALDIADIIENGSFRSADVDDWPDNVPTEVSLQAVNAGGEILWSVTFDARNTNYTLTDWFQQTKILESFSDDLVQTSDRKTRVNENNHMICISKSSDSEEGWFTVENDSPAPKIRFVRNILPASSFTSNSGSWWSGLIYKSLGSTGMEFMIDLSNDSDSVNDHIYIRKQLIQVKKGLFSINSNSYQFYYSQEPCYQGNMTAYTDETGNIRTFTSKLLQYSIDTIAVWCFKAVLLDPIPTGYTAYFSGTALTDNFVEAHAVAVVAFWNPEVSNEATTELPSTFGTSSTTAVQDTSTQAVELQSSQSTDLVEVTTQSNMVEELQTISTTYNFNEVSVGLLTEANTLYSSPEESSLEPNEASSLQTSSMASLTSVVATQVVSTQPFGTTLLQTNIDPTTGYKNTLSTISVVQEESAVQEVTSAVSVSITPKPSTLSASCYCPCSSFNSSDLTAAELEQSIKDLRKHLTLNKTQLSNFQRKLISAGDNRESAKRLGYVGVLVITLVIGGLVCLDIAAFAHVFQTFRYKLMSRSPTVN